MSKNGWTQERRQKQSEAIKRWKPWEKSTGAKTIEGIEKSKMNAYKHGGRSHRLRYLLQELQKMQKLREFFKESI